MKRLKEEIQAFKPGNEQEEKDKQVLLDFMDKNEDCFERSNLIAHFTASLWTVNKERTKALLVYHNIYHSWSWIGGHADGNTNLKEVALKELQEETGVKQATLVSPDIFSLETLTVDGHWKKGIYVPSHLHLNVTYLAEASEKEELVIKPDENKNVKWWKQEVIRDICEEPWMMEHIYQKLIDRSQK